MLVGSNASFSCRVRDSYVDWKAMFSNGTEKKLSEQMDDIFSYYWPQQGRERNSILIINTSNALGWNNTFLQCVAHSGVGIDPSNAVALVIYASLSKQLMLLYSK